MIIFVLFILSLLLLLIADSEAILAGPRCRLIPQPQLVLYPLMVDTIHLQVSVERLVLGQRRHVTDVRAPLLLLVHYFHVFVRFLFLLARVFGRDHQLFWGWHLRFHLIETAWAYGSVRRWQVLH